jgi:hypothetical protein
MTWASSGGFTKVCIFLQRFSFSKPAGQPPNAVRYGREEISSDNRHALFLGILMPEGQLIAELMAKAI